MYKLRFLQAFDAKYIKLLQKDKSTGKRIDKTLNLLMVDPNYPSLKSHKANTTNYGVRWSSKITGDVRIIWDYDETEPNVINLLGLGGHSGKKKVYK